MDGVQVLAMLIAWPYLGDVPPGLSPLARAEVVVVKRFGGATPVNGMAGGEEGPIGQLAAARETRRPVAALVVVPVR